MELRSFECIGNAEILQPNIVKIVIAEIPKMSGVGGYLEEGKSSLPNIDMLLKHYKHGSLYSVEAVDKTVPFQHSVVLRECYKSTNPKPIKDGDAFLYAGFYHTEVNPGPKPPIVAVAD